MLKTLLRVKAQNRILVRCLSVLSAYTDKLGCYTRYHGRAWSARKREEPKLSTRAAAGCKAWHQHLQHAGGRISKPDAQERLLPKNSVTCALLTRIVAQWQVPRRGQHARGCTGYSTADLAGPARAITSLNMAPKHAIGSRPSSALIVP